MIELGGSIFLENFEVVEQGQLIVVRKIVGNYTKKIAEKHKDFKKITISILPNSKFKIKVILETSEEKISEAEDKNLFFAIDKALAGVYE